ncbi:MAG: adenylyl-sulfate kinase [Flavobacteriales bacterium]|nr:adenylyl-sulfate kinase [Flavobacteriales bacterium]|tara:strand:- start:582 stop:1190 length:609 start_codon:yes stop_codon:yes gene_type:complete
MKNAGNNVFPIFDELLQKTDKEELLKQKSFTVWMTGLSGSGKSTIAKGLERYLHEQRFLTKMLDGDNIRVGINNNLGFSEDDRIENIRRIAEVSKLFINCGVITLNCFVSPTREMRQMAKEIIGTDNFIEVFINASVAECEKRDVKGLYAKARAGEIKNFTGIDAPFEAPTNAAVEVNTAELSIDASIQKVLNYIIPKIENN